MPQIKGTHTRIVQKKQKTSDLSLLIYKHAPWHPSAGPHSSLSSADSEGVPLLHPCRLHGRIISEVAKKTTSFTYTPWHTLAEGSDAPPFPELLHALGSMGVTDAGRGPHKRPHRSAEAVPAKYRPMHQSFIFFIFKWKEKNLFLRAHLTPGGEGRCVNSHLGPSHTSAGVNWVLGKAAFSCQLPGGRARCHLLCFPGIEGLATNWPPGPGPFPQN